MSLVMEEEVGTWPGSAMSSIPARRATVGKRSRVLRGGRAQKVPTRSVCVNQNNREPRLGS